MEYMMVNGQIPSVLRINERSVLLFFFKDCLFIYCWEEREKEKERNINVWLPLTQA